MNEWEARFWQSELQNAATNGSWVFHCLWTLCRSKCHLRSTISPSIEILLKRGERIDNSYVFQHRNLTITNQNKPNRAWVPEPIWHHYCKFARCLTLNLVTASCSLDPWHSPLVICQSIVYIHCTWSLRHLAANLDVCHFVLSIFSNSKNILMTSQWWRHQPVRTHGDLVHGSGQGHLLPMPSHA